MIKRGKGVPLTSIAHPVPIIKLNADEGKTLRYIYLFSLLLIEGTVWFLGISMEWVEEVSQLGDFPCTPVSYPKKPDFANDLGNFLQGDSDLALIYNYGLPLGDGLAGGFAAWPKENPLDSFTVEHVGVGYAVNAVCGKLELAPNGTENGLTQFYISSMDVWSTLFSLTLHVQLPAGSHDWAPYLDRDITQECVVRYIMGDATINFAFNADEWRGVISGSLQSMTINNPKDNSESVNLNLYQTSDVYFGRIQDAFGVNDKYENITQWVIEATQLVFSNQSYGTSQGALFANLFQWATLPDGFYHTNRTWKGVTAAVALTAHYILLQYDDSGVASCSYSGANGAGKIDAPKYVIVLTWSAVVICLLAELSQLFWWFLLSGGGEKNDRAARILESPMQLLYDIRLGGTELMGELYGDNQSPEAIRQHYSEVLVRFGESRLTRPNPVGMLILGAPGEVMAMNEHREYY
ncbi:hypothetical protein BC830DRAFT_242766 [Chytriomyces sp. MP71]|nr:hypothetical protein BC830DRAFT_242766 [Chytriomyces sp. MP71]